MASSIKIDKKGLNKLKLNMRYLDGSSVDGGFLNNDMHDFNNTLATITKWQEFGTVKTGRNKGKVGIPERPFLSQSFLINRSVYKRMMAKHVARLMRGETTTSPVLNIFGRRLRRDIRMSIKNWTEPVNAPYTVERKGKNDPLMDTGRMYDGVSFRRNIVKKRPRK